MNHRAKRISFGEPRGRKSLARKNLSTGYGDDSGNSFGGENLSGREKFLSLHRRISFARLIPDSGF